MSRKLIGVVALAFVLAFSCAAFAEVQNVKIGGDISILGFSRYGFNLAEDNSKGISRGDASGLAEIATVKIDADLTDAVAATIVLKNEKIWGTTTGDASDNSDLDVYVSEAFITMKEFMGQPLTLKLGQMGIRLGSGLLVGDPDTNQDSDGPFADGLGDLSTRKAFTGAVGILDLAPVTVTAGALKVTEGSLAANSDDVNAYLVNLGYDLKELGLQSGIVEIYDVYKDAKKTSATDTPTSVNNIGGRIQVGLTDTISVGGEVVGQTQKGIRDDRKSSSDVAYLLNASMSLPDVVMSPTIGLDYTHLSQNWNPMFEDMTPADIANVLFPNSNVRCIGATVGLKPMTDVGLKLRYANFQAVHGVSAISNDWGTYSLNKDNKQLGDEIDIHLAYDYTEDVQFGLQGGYFIPGKAFDRTNRKSASQVIGSMKVSF